MCMTLGDLLRAVDSARTSSLANRQTAERLAVQRSPLIGHWWSVQANVCKWRPSPDSTPGIERIQLFCEEQYGSLDSGAIRKMRAVVCGRRNLKISEADELPLEDVAHILDASKGKPATAVSERVTKPPKRSWTQPDLDEAIREYKANRASCYPDLVAVVKKGKSGAIDSARKMFGRNAIVRELRVRSPAMVTKSAVWQAIRDELGLGRQSRRPKKTGLDIALEDKAVATNNPVVEQAIRRETVQLVRKSMDAEKAEATIEKLQRGDISDDKARELAVVVAEQQQDDLTRNVHSDF